MKATLQTMLVLSTIVVIGQAAMATPADDQYAIAASHYANQQWELAAAEFDDFLKRFQRHSRASDAEFYAAEALVQLRRFKEAGPRFERFVLQNQQHPQVSRALFRWGECSYLAGDQVEALRLLSQFQSQNEVDTLNQYALPYLGNLYAETDDLPAARRAYGLAIEQFPDGGLADECHLQLAILAYGDGDYPIVIDRLRELDTAFPESRFRAESAYWSGMAQFQQSQHEASAASFETVLEIDAEHRRAAASNYFAGESWRRHGDANRARSFFQTLLAGNKDGEWTDDALVGLIRISLGQQDYEQLDAHMAVMESNSADSPRIFEARQLYGESLVKRNHYDEAIRLLSVLTRPGSAAEKHGEKSSAVNLYLLGVAHLGAEQPQQAIEALDRIHQSPKLSPYFLGQIHLARATASDLLGEHDDAIATIREALSQNPSKKLEGQLRITLIRSLLKEDQYEQAELAFREWNATAPTDNELRTSATRYLAEYSFDHEEYERASSYYAHLLSAGNKSQLHGLSGIAWCHFKMNNYEDAASLFEQLMNRFPQSLEAKHAKLARARSLQLLKQDEQALPVYEEIVNSQEGGREWVSASLAAAEILDSKGELDRAYELLSRLTDHPDAQPRQDQVLYQLGWLLTRRGQTDEAIEAFEQLHRGHPDSQHWGDATFRLADQRFRSGELKEAADLLDLIALRPPAELDAKLSSFTLHLRGRIAAATRRWSDVLPPMRKLLAEHPGSPLADSAQFWLAEAHYQMANYEAAGRHLSVIQSNDNEPWRAMVLLRKAQISAARRRWAEANSHILSLQERFPEFDREYEATYLIGRMHAVRGEFREARDAFQSVVESENGRLTETAAIAQWMIGETYLHQKEFQQALRAYLKVEMLYDYPRWRAAALLQAGKCCERLGQVDKARKLYERLTEQLPATSYHAAAKRRLKSIKPPARSPDDSQVKEPVE